MTPAQLYRASWVPHPVPVGDQTELIGPWIVPEPWPRILTAVQVGENVFVLSSLSDGTILECWRVLPR